MGNRTILRTKPNRSGGGSGIAGIDVKIDDAAFTKAAARLVNKNIKRFVNKAPGIVRQSMREAITNDNLFGSEWAGDWIQRLKSEQRNPGKAKRGSGVRLKFSNNLFEIRFEATRKFVEPEMGRDGAFYFISKSFGTTGGSLPKRDKAYPVAIKGGDSESGTYDGERAKYDNKIMPDKREGRALIFVHGPILIDAVDAIATWPEETVTIAKRKMQEDFSR